MVGVLAMRFPWKKGPRGKWSEGAYLVGTVGAASCLLVGATILISGLMQLMGTPFGMKSSLVIHLLINASVSILVYCGATRAAGLEEAVFLTQGFRQALRKVNVRLGRSGQ